MKRICFCVFMICMLISRTGEAQTITVDFEDWPPYQFVRDGKVIGIDTEVLEEAFQRMGVSAKFVSVPWQRALKETETGEADAIFSLAYPDQHTWLHFPATPISAQRSVLFVRKDSDIKISAVTDLEGKNVGVVRGNLYGDVFDKNTKIVRDEASDQYMIFNKLLGNRYDIMISFDLVGLYIAKEKNISDQVKMLDFVIDDQPTYVGFSKAKGDAAKQLAEKLSVTLDQLRKEGFMDKIRKKYLE